MLTIQIGRDASEDDYAEAISAQLEVRQSGDRLELREQEVSITGEDEHYSHLRGGVQTGLGRLPWRAKLIKVVFSTGIYHVEPVE
jgi:hypothetical protein